MLEKLIIFLVAAAINAAADYLAQEPHVSDALEGQGLRINSPVLVPSYSDEEVVRAPLSGALPCEGVPSNEGDDPCHQ